ncbi:ATP-binding cassette domain-containing protein [Alkalibaculum sp. M08DMB]|uniref:ATP-binding cassette domain-containing protein n=1 Tax=Alkalibaculum sporogenes TaxID=2655001 RepID=A0A6A7KA34_9FIRM|nr:ATP-binding cassette domain-containing protein [Alkalibaculum sporogenes]MPW26368.1 ATP-binding cassette domain-containing protein [Alkalibaculum sporogenes]
MLEFNFNTMTINDKLLYNGGELTIIGNGITLLTGENGTGKSTLLKQLYFTNRSNSVYISQDNDEMLQKLSVLENITMIQDIYSDKDLIKLLNSMGIGELSNKNINTMSGGEKKIISVLRGLLSNAEILFIDEPTNDLDYRIVNKLIDIINEYRNKKIIIIVTHDERMYESSEQIYEIRNQSVVKIIEEKKTNEKQTLILYERVIINTSLICKRIFNKDLFGIVLLLMFVMSTLYLIIDTKASVYNYNSIIKQNQINICNTLYKNPKELIREGYIPTYLLQFIKSDLPIRDISKKVKEYTNEMMEQSYSVNLILPYSNTYDVYYLLFYNTRENIEISTFDVLLEKINNYDSNEVNIDTNDYFKFNFNNKNNTTKNIKFEIKSYKDSINYIYDNYNKNNLETTFCSVILQDTTSFYDFISNNELTNLWDGNYYIQSNETINLLNEANIYLTSKSNYQKYFVIITVYILFEIFNNFINIYIIKKRISIFRNYGFHKHEITSEIIKIYNQKNACIFCSILVVLINFFSYFKDNQWKVINNNIFPLVFIVVLVLVYRYKKLIFNNLIKDEFNFGGVYEN